MTNSEQLLLISAHVSAAAALRASLHMEANPHDLMNTVAAMPPRRAVVYLATVASSALLALANTAL